jgi:hypothetical protein
MRFIGSPRPVRSEVAERASSASGVSLARLIDLILGQVESIRDDSAFHARAVGDGDDAVESAGLAVRLLSRETLLGHVDSPM